MLINDTQYSLCTMSIAGAELLQLQLGFNYRRIYRLLSVVGCNCTAELTTQPQ